MFLLLYKKRHFQRFFFTNGFFPIDVPVVTPDLSYIHQMVKGFIQKMAREKAQIIEMWHYRAERVDFYARRIFPLTYILILFTIMAGIKNIC